MNSLQNTVAYHIRVLSGLIVLILLSLSPETPAQVRITDGSILTMDINSLLELESSTRGLLIPRVAIGNLTQAAPLTAPVPTGMMVYSLGGSVTDGFYYWNGTSWIMLATGSAQWVTNGANIYYNTGNVGIGVNVPVEKLEVNGDIKIGSTTSGTIRSTNELVLRQDGDVYGPSILRIRNRTGENGAIFETSDATYILVDFIFKNAANQGNIRFESRAAFARTGVPSFHFGGANPDSPTLSLGYNYAAFNKNVRIGDYNSPLTALDVNGQITLRTGASAGALLVSDANGTGTWTNPGGVRDVPVTKSVSDTLLKTETVVLASGNITLTLPVVTSADDGLSIIINNVGIHTDLVNVVTPGSATIDSEDHTHLTRWVGFNYIAHNGNWVIANNINKSEDLFDVSETSSWKTIPEVIEYLSLHMIAPSVVRLDGDVFSLASTQIIDLPYPVTIEGLSAGVSVISPASGFTGGLFSCVTSCDFKMLKFTSTFGATSGHDAIHLTGGSNKSSSIKNCSFTGFNKGISITGNLNTWMVEDSFINIVVSGIELAAGVASGSILSTSTLIFANCGIGINLLSGTNATISFQNNHFFCFAGGQIGLNYVPATFLTTSAMTFTSNTWNYIGAFISGFDFARADGRDANFYIESNAGIDNKSPKCKINVINNALTTTLTTANNWYKANWVNTSSFTVNWLINNNRITFQSKNTRDILIILSGNISVNNANRVITVGIVENGITATRLGETSLRVVTSGQPFQYSTTIYVQNVALNDYFEVFVSSANNSDNVTFQDVNMFVSSQ
jgi:hypothetical protein